VLHTTSVHEPRPPRSPGPPRSGRRRVVVALEQLALDFASGARRWTFSRNIAGSPHQARIVERLEFVRRFFPELDGVTIHVGQAMKRGILGWGSMDPERPGIWVRPRRLAYFTIAHELTHLLQARGLAPVGERACDLWALARSALVIDVPPCYLRLPRAIRNRRALDPAMSSLLHRVACAALERRAAGNRRYLTSFERDVADAFAARPWRRRAPGGAGDRSTTQLALVE